jgi:hypothetical protein
MSTNRPQEIREQAINGDDSALVDLGTRTVQKSGEYTCHITIPKGAVDNLDLLEGDDVRFKLDSISNRLIAERDTE